MSLRRALFSAVATVALSLAAATPAWATFPGRNGVIVYAQAPLDPNGFDNGKPGTGQSDLRTVAPDGTDDHAITDTQASESVPIPSPDGQRLVYVRGATLWLSAIDGSGARRLPRTGGSDLPTWGPDGRHLLWSAEDGGIRSVDLSPTYTPQAPPKTLVDARFDGRQSRGFVAAQPLLSADGRSLVYTRLDVGVRDALDIRLTIWAARPDGTGRHQLLESKGDYREAVAADISPDSTRLLFGGARNTKGSLRRIFVAGMDGSGARLLTTAPAGHSEYTGFAWSPDGTSIVAARNESGAEHGAVLEVIDVATGATRTVKRIATGAIENPRWQSVPAS